MLVGLFLGIIQGLTEFLPVSSSGHLVLLQQFFEVGEDEVLFDLVLHLGTLLPVLLFYRTDVIAVLRDPLAGEGPFWRRQGVRMLSLVFLASLPTAIIGLAFEDLFEVLFATPAALSVTFAITGVLLFASGRFLGGTTTLDTMTWRQAVLLGLAQGLAITPGISRSGTTISVALMLGLNRELAARFSFLMSVPAILGAVLLKARHADFSAVDTLQFGAGGLAAMVSGYLALAVLVRLVQGGQFKHFAWYAWAMALVAGGIAIWVA
ncbi:MAG: undecaprenyl-diphosphate phosphatase [Deltaproteobacteria bacterium]|nr:undecaprenyl-diphosphate phosphatase [Deltaproteobacteria bacterium]